MSYNTKQRECIIEFFEKNREKSFTAAEIINNKLVPVGNATVFRYLSSLSEEGLLRKTTGTGCAVYRFSGEECKHHLHLQCLSCGKIEHMDCGFMHEIQKHIATDHHFEIDNKKTVIYGICADCGRKK